MRVASDRGPLPLSRDGREFLAAQHCAALSRRANVLRVMSILISVLLMGVALVLADRVQTGEMDQAPTPIQMAAFIGAALLISLIPHVLLAQAVGADRAWAEMIDRSGLTVHRDRSGHPVLATTRSRPWYSLSVPVLISDYLLTLVPPLSFVMVVTYAGSLSGSPLVWPVVSLVTIAFVIMLASWLNVVWVIHQCHAQVQTAGRAEAAPADTAPRAEPTPAGGGDEPATDRPVCRCPTVSPTRATT